MKIASELKTDDIMQKDNRLGFPKMPSKNRLSLFIIQIIARKDKRFSSENDKNGNLLISRTRNSLHLRRSKCLHN